MQRRLIESRAESWRLCGAGVGHVKGQKGVSLECLLLGTLQHLHRLFGGLPGGNGGVHWFTEDVLLCEDAPSDAVFLPVEDVRWFCIPKPHA